MRRDQSLIVAAEVALAALTLAAVLGMSRLFADGGWLGPLTVNALAAHLVVSVSRRRGLSLGASAGVTAITAGLVTVWTSYGATTTLGVPTGDTFSAVRSDLDRAWALYQDVVAPAPVETGFVFASCLAVWVIAYVADWAGFRLRIPFEATLPAGTLFLFTALLGAPRGRGWATGLFAGATLAFLLLHRLAREDRAALWVADRHEAGRRALLAAGTALGVVAVVSGTVLGPLLPGADEPGVLDPRGLGANDGTRVTISPLVDIRARLVDQSNLEVFRVRASEPAYWRLTSLDRFDGRIWSSSGSYEEAEGTLPDSTPTNLPATTLQQSFEIEALAAIWLPGAYEARSIDAVGASVLYEPGSSTLIVDRDSETSDDLTYDLESASPRITAADLQGAAGPLPEDIRTGYLDLPVDFSASVRQQAEQITALATTPYAAALALQSHLRSFTYDLTVPAGHSGDALETFLFVTQRGYCEQFAGAFAAMARAVGLPARVAVGFTQGERDTTDLEVFRVRGEHAHAWPEVYLAGAGWVSFEPTPGRGQPFAEPYTGVPAAQAGPADPTTATTSPAATETTAAPSIPDGSGERPNRDDELDTAPSTGTGGGSEGLATRLLIQPLRETLPWLLLAALAGVTLVSIARLLRLRLRRRRARTPLDRISLAWTEAAEAAALLGHREIRSDTIDERADRLAAVVPDGRDAALALTHRVEIALYSAEGADELDAELAEEASASIVDLARSATPLPARVRPWVDPRPAMRRWRGTRPGLPRVTAPLRAAGRSASERMRSTAGR